MYDRTTDGRTLKCLTIEDAYTRAGVGGPGDVNYESNSKIRVAGISE